MINKLTKILLISIMLLLAISPTIYANMVIEPPDFNFTIDDDGMANVEDVNGEISSSNAWQRLFDEYGTFIKGAYGIFILTCVLILVLNIVKFASSGENPQARSTAMKALLVSGIGLSLLGAVGIIFSMSFNFLST